MKNIELCKKCYFGRIIEAEDGTVVGRTCELPISTFIYHSQLGVYKNETDDECYDFFQIQSEPKKLIVGSDPDKTNPQNDKE